MGGRRKALALYSITGRTADVHVSDFALENDGILFSIYEGQWARVSQARE